MAQEIHTSEHEHSEAHTSAHDDHSKTVLFGRVLPYPIYTVVFGALAVLTICEIIIAELPDGFLTVPLLVALSLTKAVLVVMFYMHLRQDSRIFTATLLIPVLMALVAVLFLIAVPSTGY